jgi:hypothetical protein
LHHGLLDGPHLIPEIGEVKHPGFRMVEVFLGHFTFIELFDDRLKAECGLTSGQLRRALVALKRYVFEAWKPRAEYTLVSRGMWFVDAHFVRGNLIYGYEVAAEAEGADPQEAAHVIDRYLKILGGGDPKDIDLLMKKGVKALCGDDKLTALDLSLIHQPVIGLLLDLQIDDDMKNIKGAEFEHFLRASVEADVPGVTLPIPPGRRLQKEGNKRTYAEVDLYAQVQDVLFLIDCKAYSVTRDYLKGSVRAITNRWGLVQEWLATSDGRAGEIARNPKGANYEIPQEVKFLVPVVCSAFVEFVWTDDAKFYLDAKRTVPRVCSVTEIVEIMKSDFEHLRHSAFAVPVRS